MVPLPYCYPTWTPAALSDLGVLVLCLPEAQPIGKNSSIEEKRFNIHQRSAGSADKLSSELSMDQVILLALISKDLLENDSLEIQPGTDVWLLTMMPVGIFSPHRAGRQATVETGWQGYSGQVS